MVSDVQGVRVSSPSRLHFSLIDMNGAYSGRVDGGVGLAIARPRVGLFARKRSNGVILVSRVSDEINSDLALSNELTSALRRVQELYNLDGIHLEIVHSIPAHSGFGSKTQTLLSAAFAYCQLYKVSATPREIANLIGRGGTSGIGVEAFNSGGFIVDCGHAFRLKNYSFRPSSASTSLSPAPLVGRYNFPSWPILIVTPKGRKIHGIEEQRLFEQVCPIPLADAQACAHIVLMMLIPAVLEGDLQTFCKGINMIQELTWKRFEIESQASIVRIAMELLSKLGLDGIGMSSWGTTVFAFGSMLEDAEATNEVLVQVQHLLDASGGGLCFITRTDNVGARIEIV